MEQHSSSHVDNVGPGPGGSSLVRVTERTSYGLSEFHIWGCNRVQRHPNRAYCGLKREAFNIQSYTDAYRRAIRY